MRYAVLAAPDDGGMRTAVLPFSALPPGARRGLVPLPLYAARWVETCARSAMMPGAGVLARLRWRLLTRRLEEGLQRMGLPGGALLRCTPGELDEMRRRAGRADARVLQAMTGRLWLGTELVRAAGATGQDPADVLAAAEALVAQGRARRWAAVEVDRQGAVCRRCGTRTGIYPEACGRCGSPFCPRCSRCAAMGVARGCEPMFGAPAPLLDHRRDVGGDAPVAWALDATLIESLSPAQRRAFDQVRALAGAALERGLPCEPGLADLTAPEADPAPWVDGRGCLVWAVTGAGKTEVAFGAAEVVLRLGGRVLFATPRREIAAQVAERARRAFDGLEVRLLVGRGPRAAPSGPERHDGEWRPVAPGGLDRLVVSTTHQALRLYRAFALVVLDEFDAFPYSGSRMLALAVHRAAHPDGFRVVMSATPGRDDLARARRAGWPVVHVPVRHHGHPLPVPQLWVDRSMRAWERSPGDPGRVPAYVAEWLRRRRPDARVLVFCPTVALAQALAQALRCPVCHSAHPRRERILQEFGASRDGVLVTTTLLERGVTFPGVDVLVAFADHEPIFDEAALVQMAGRAGRSAQRPDGRVLFAAATMSRSMGRARSAIEAMNRLAGQLGFLVGGDGPAVPPGTGAGAGPGSGA